MKTPTIPSFSSGSACFLSPIPFARLSLEEVGSLVGSVHSGCADRISSGSSHGPSVSLYTNSPLAGVLGQYMSWLGR